MKKIVLLIMVMFMFGCSGVRMNSAYDKQSADLSAKICKSDFAGDKVIALKECADFWAGVYSESKVPVFGKVYLSPVYSNLVAANVARSAVDAQDAEAGNLTDDVMGKLLRAECVAIGDIINADLGLKGE